jgi:hypothetical protein
MRCVSKMRCEYLEFRLLYCVACMCSLYLVLKFLPICPTYFNGHSLHLFWYIPLLLYLSVWFFGLEVVLYCVFSFVCYSYICVFK